jgi:hypothetical protein
MTDHYYTFRSDVGAQKRDDGKEPTMMTLKEGLCDGQANGGQSALSSSPPAATALLCSMPFEKGHGGGRGGHDGTATIFSAASAQPRDDVDCK